MQKLTSIEKVIKTPIYSYLKEVVKQFGYRNIALEMQPIVRYLLNTVLLSMCGAFEEKVETCKYFIAGIDLQSRYTFLKSVAKSEYTAKNIISITNQIRKFVNNNDVGKNIGYVYSEYCVDVKKLIEDLLKDTVINEYFKMNNQLYIWEKHWRCEYKDDELIDIYNGLFLDRHRLAHNLKSLCSADVSLDDMTQYKSNYFIKLSLLICFDLYIMSIMEEILKSV